MGLRKRSRWSLFSNPLIPRPTRNSRQFSRQPNSQSRRKKSGPSFWQLDRREKGRFLLKWAGLFAGGFILFSLLLFAVYAKDLPNPTNLSSREIAESTKILDRNGNILYEIYNEERRTLVASDRISNYVKEATVALEDDDFYNHHGIDLTGIMSAAFDNITGRTTYTRGGSTITQQFIKNALLTKEKTISRKLKEAILSIEIETIYSKDEILSGYINEIPYGSNAYGIESAAHTYFNKSAADLTLSESAFLASIPQRPSYFSPYGDHLDKLFARKDYALDQMVKKDFITKEEAEEAKLATPTLENPGLAERKESIRAPHFVFHVRDQLVELLGGEEEAEQRLAKEGFTVTTTLDLETQELAELALEEQAPSVFERRNASNSALVAIDPNSGDVLAMVGSIDFFEEKFGSVNVATSLRQPGSSFKPIVYATGFEGAYSPATVLFDLKTDFGGGYSPSNYDGSEHGPVTAREALAWSLNIPAVKMLELAGLDESLKMARDLGINSLNDRDRYGLSLVLGAGEVQLLELVHAYSVFANEGEIMPLTTILKVTDKEGKTIVDITEDERKGKQVLNKQTAYLMSDILSDNATRANVFGNSLVIGGHQVAAKTGTTQSYRDAWTIGYTPQIAAGVWVGNNDNTEMRSGSSGSVTAAPIWRAFMNAFLSDKENMQFPRPGELQQVEVDKLSGKLPSDSCSTERVSDWFTSWNKPTEKDDVHQEVKIDKVSLKLATEDTPEEFIEIRCYRQVHSLRPEKPNWEGPVLAWAETNGYSQTDQPPTEFDDVHTEAKRPTIQISTPTNNSKVDNNFEIKSATSSSFSIDKVEYYLNDEFIGDAKDNPYSMSVSGKNAGKYTLKAKVTDKIGNVGETTIEIEIKEKNAPGAVSSPSGSASGGTVTLSWTNPTDGDLASVRIYESGTSSTIGNLVKTVSTLPNTNSSAKLYGKVTGTYYYTLRPIDNNGNENQSSNRVSVTVP